MTISEYRRDRAGREVTAQVVGEGGPEDAMDPCPAGLVAGLADRFRFGRELGRGGMATVYLADDLKHGRQVAVKVLRPAVAAAIGAERFLTEIKVTAALHHPHLVSLFDSGACGGQLFYVMPYVEGGSLRARLSREKPLAVPDALRIARDIAAALDHAHRHGVFHGDVKPGNILLQDGQALLADFGIASVEGAGEEAGDNESGLAIGTAAYMSPEQARIGPAAAGGDIYSLGVVLYEMLCGEPPFTGSCAQAIISRALTEEAPRIRTWRRAVPQVVEDVLAVALQRLPADRFRTAAEFAEVLDECLLRATSERVAWSRPRKESRRLPWAAILSHVTLGTLRQ